MGRYGIGRLSLFVGSLPLLACSFAGDPGKRTQDDLTAKALARFEEFQYVPGETEGREPAVNGSLKAAEIDDCEGKTLLSGKVNFAGTLKADVHDMLVGKKHPKPFSSYPPETQRRFLSIYDPPIDTLTIPVQHNVTFCMRPGTTTLSGSVEDNGKQYALSPESRLISGTRTSLQEPGLALSLRFLRPNLHYDDLPPRLRNLSILSDKGALPVFDDRDTYSVDAGIMLRKIDSSVTQGEYSVIGVGGSKLIEGFFNKGGKIQGPVTGRVEVEGNIRIAESEVAADPVVVAPPSPKIAGTLNSTVPQPGTESPIRSAAPASPGVPTPVVAPIQNFPAPVPPTNSSLPPPTRTASRPPVPRETTMAPVPRIEIPPPESFSTNPVHSRADFQRLDAYRKYRDTSGGTYDEVQRACKGMRQVAVVIAGTQTGDQDQSYQRSADPVIDAECVAAAKDVVAAIRESEFDLGYRLHFCQSGPTQGDVFVNPARVDDKGNVFPLAEWYQASSNNMYEDPRTKDVYFASVATRLAPKSTFYDSLPKLDPNRAYIWGALLAQGTSDLVPQKITFIGTIRANNGRPYYECSLPGISRLPFCFRTEFAGERVFRALRFIGVHNTGFDTHPFNRSWADEARVAQR
ncbi:MAG TPA: hypothetical protein VI895_14940 [Bdellovibrionota bacterium]|nr:hypothetical protein [Bdellovibrionota bacterium]